MERRRLKGCTQAKPGRSHAERVGIQRNAGAREGRASSGGGRPEAEAEGGDKLK